MCYEIVGCFLPSAETIIRRGGMVRPSGRGAPGSTQDGQAVVQAMGCAPVPLVGRPCDRPSCAASANPLVSCCPPASQF
jgi:hypothetical protein